MPARSGGLNCHPRGGLLVVAIVVLVGCRATSLVKPVSCSSSCKVVAPTPSDSRLAFPERLDQGYTIVLPGIWGAQPVDYGIVTGLQDADLPSAIELYDWTAGAARLLYNLRAVEHNRAQARNISAKIVAYQDRYPGRPVHLIGYSGGAAVAVLTLEAMPADRSVNDVVLMAPTLASDYDLRPALGHAKHGIRNFYSPLDVPLLMVLSTAFGTTEGRHTVAAGAIGFEPPKELGPEARRAYESQVSQQSYELGMLADGHPGGHFGWSNRTFVAHRLAPLLATPTIPQSSAEAASATTSHVVQASARY